jgi:hypothetical protein
MGLSDDVKRFKLKVDRVTQDVFVNVCSATLFSITDGSTVTGSPGQPVDTGYLRASWLLGWGGVPAFALNGEGAKRDAAWSGAPNEAAPAAPAGVTMAVIATNAAYANVIEDGLIGVGRGNVTGETKQRITLRTNLRNGTGAQIGGPHAVSLTIVGLPGIVEDEARKLGVQ